jgi:hypothetical protein
MNCYRTKELLSEYIDGLLDKEQESLVRDHLLLCGDCRDEFESMKAVVREMGSLDKIKAPDDFLAALHGRMERESWFQKVKNFLFMPARIRIPVELATLATTVVLAFFIFHIVQLMPLKSPSDLKDKKPEPEIRSSEGMPAAGSGIKQPEPVDVTDNIMAPPLKKQKALPPELPAVKTFKSEETDHIQEYVKTLTAAQPAKRREPLQVLLLLEPVEEKENLSPEIKENAKLYNEKQAKEETAVPAPVRLQARTKAGAAELMSRDETPPAGKSFEAKGNTIPYKEGLLENIREHIKNAGGTLLKTDMNNDTGQPEYLLIEISGQNYPKLIEKLAGFGKVQTPVAGDPGQSGEPVQVRIRIVSPNRKN